MRCPDCAKFVGYDDGSVDEVEADIDADTGEVTIGGRVVLPCAECGTDLKELTVDDAADAAALFGTTPVDVVNANLPTRDGFELVGDWVERHTVATYEVDGDFDKEFHERTQATVSRPIKKGGKVVGHKTVPIKSSRYMKTYKGVTVTGTVKRTVRCPLPEDDPVVVEETEEFEHTVEEQASAFDEC